MCNEADLVEIAVRVTFRHMIRTYMYWFEITTVSAESALLTYITVMCESVQVS